MTPHQLLLAERERKWVKRRQKLIDDWFWSADPIGLQVEIEGQRRRIWWGSPHGIGNHIEDKIKWI